jgi:citrate/tricarballylate utilization protein
VHTLDALVADARRQLEVCNACRYCEGYCAVFPALERRAILTDGDVVFLANLCHDCRACYQACMYTPPHPFEVDIPQALGDVRRASYRRLAWPARLSGAFLRPFATQAAAHIIGLALVAAIVAGSGVRGFTVGGDEPGSFYRVVPDTTMIVLFLALTGLAAAVLGGSFVRFWRGARVRERGPLSVRALLRTTVDVATLRFLRGGGGNCYYPDPDRPRRGRRDMHLLVLYGLMLAFAATVAAGVEQHAFGKLPPYPIVSVPVLLGIVGGAATLVGGVWLALLKVEATRRRDVGDRRLDYAFLVTLEVVTVSGLLLLALRSSAAMAPLLIVHLASVVALYLVIPFSKFVHASHRTAALLIDAAEEAHERRL